jgi:methylated-DNA-[protein]-cysteine S-methyltransferase
MGMSAENSSPASRSMWMTSPIGWLWIGHDGGKILRIEFADQKRTQLQSNAEINANEDPFSLKIKKQIEDYFAGKLLAFELPLAWENQGTEFQVRVWQALLEIPYGQTRSYQDIAAAAGSPRGARAVGNAVNKNPWPIIVPCHRVIAADGSIGGFASDIVIKHRLLRTELR